MSIYKGVAFRHFFSLTNTDGTPNNTETPTCEVKKDAGDYAASTNSPARAKRADGVTESNTWHLNLTATEMNADAVAILPIATGCVQVPTTLYTTGDYTSARAGYLDIINKAIPDEVYSTADGLPLKKDLTSGISTVTGSLDTISGTLADIISDIADVARQVWNYATRRLTNNVPQAVMTPGAAMNTRTLSNLANQMSQLYPPPKGREVTPGQCLLRLQYAWQEFVRQCGGCYRRSVEYPVTVGLRTFTLPADLREILPGRVRLGYESRAIASISRTGNVLTIVTAAEHDLAAGLGVTLDGTTGAGGTTFDGTVTVKAVASTTQFTADQAGDDDTGSGGTVEASSTKYLTPKTISASPWIETEDGVPSYYHFPDPVTLVLDKPSDGSVGPLLIVEYDGHPTQDDLAAVLPTPGFVDECLMSYAAGKLNLIAWPQALEEFQQGVKRWGQEMERRAEMNEQAQE